MSEDRGSCGGLLSCEGSPVGMKGWTLRSPRCEVVLVLVAVGAAALAFGAVVFVAVFEVVFEVGFVPDFVVRFEVGVEGVGEFRPASAWVWWLRVSAHWRIKESSTWRVRRGGGGMLDFSW